MKRIAGAILIGLVLALLLVTSAKADPPLFGFAAIACDHDDPSDAEIKSDYMDEVAGWTTANHVCISGDLTETADRLRRAHATFTPIFYIEPVFFERRANQLVPAAQSEALWDYAVAAIAASGVPPSEIIFYLVDEPLHLGLSLDQVGAAAVTVRQTYPGAQILVIEALRDGVSPEVPDFATFWGFNRYGLRDPAGDPTFARHLQDALAQLGPDQRLALIMDAQFTPIHAASGLTPAEMSQVALAYEALARSEPRIGLLLGYTWAGGIDGPWEQGLRQLPPEVIDTYRAIGLRLQ